MIIVPNGYSKQQLQQDYPDTPILLLSHYIDTLLLQTHASIAPKAYIQHLLLKQTDKYLVDSLTAHIAHILRENITLSANHPNSSWLREVINSLLRALSNQHYLHPESAYQFLIEENIHLQYDNIQYYGFSYLPQNLQLFFEHYHIQPVSLIRPRSNHTFYHFSSMEEEVEHALDWAKQHPERTIIAMDRQYTSLLNRYQSQKQHNSYLSLIQNLSAPEPTIAVSSILHLYHTQQYPEGFNILSLFSSSHYQNASLVSLTAHIQSIHTPLQKGVLISFQQFFTIVSDICKFWRLETPSLQPLQLITEKLSYHQWHQRFNLLAQHNSAALDPMAVQGGQFEAVWLLGAQKTQWQQSTSLPWLSPEHQRQTSLAFLSTIGKTIIHSCQNLNTNGQPNDFFQVGTIEEPKPLSKTAITLSSYKDWAAKETTTVSSSIVRDYANCPFIAFTNHRLKLRTKLLPSHNIEPRHYGTIAHNALENLYRPISTQDDLSSVTKKNIILSVKRAWEAHPLSLHPQIEPLLQDKMINSINAWLEKDKLRPAFTILALETEKTLSIGPYQLKLRLDRVDQEDMPVLIDYKTAKLSIKEALSPLFTAPQMPMYALTESKPVKLAYAHIALDANWQSLDTSQDNDTLKQFWHHQTKACLDYYTKGQYPAKPATPDTCNRCQFSSLCRYYDHGEYLNETD